MDLPIEDPFLYIKDFYELITINAANNGRLLQLTSIVDPLLTKGFTSCG